ncbi:MAG: HupE/UreJ family protein, partial [Actinobacteria bacterium]|nr:HupE/UreJ family protein [Actinomycetota bacterium]
ALVALLVAVLVVPARVTRTVAPVVVIACGALHGLAHCTDASGRARPPSYIAGFTFTCCLLLSVGSIVGAATGRSLQARSQRRRAVAKPATDERARV